PYSAFGELIGLKGIFCDRADGVGAAWEEALAADRPVVLEFKTDPEVPPLPSHITFEEAKHFASTILEGDSREGRMITGAVRQVLSAVLPGERH
ncbi:MAG: thiamine pyrophosphate-requiring protein, partial [Variovorax sp.]|nr:thiamine pyrophosphate-requiring protein [Variovorax sp.]